ncbi:MAG TPA: ABC transporter permease [Bryobacteraceae bacterium]|jgi:putative ABC transport system permease protein|nr:ABC transporter permease [Bryobacteraceae bacterium]
MRWATIICLRLRSLFSRAKVEQELDEELRYHLEREIDAGVAASMTPEDAHYTALRSIRDIEQRKEECRDMRGLNLIENAARDIRFAIRGLRREPEFAFASIASLTLAIGMATTVFTAVNTVLLRPLNLPDPDRLALLWGEEAGGDTRAVVSFADFEDWRRNSHVFSAAAAYTNYYKPVLTGGSRPERLSGLRVSHGFFDVLKAQPALGRFFLPEEDWDGRDDVVVLSHSLWRERFRSNVGIVGQRILLDGRPLTVVGVAGPDLKPLPRSIGGDVPQIYRPVGEERGEKSRDGRHLQAIVRLKPGVTISQAQAELSVLCRRMEHLHPDTDAKLAVRVVGIRDDLTRNLRGGLIGLQLAVLAVLLIACANVANLLLARSIGRQRETAVRAALGAGVWRLARMFLAESVLLGLIAGAGGVALAFLSSTVLRTASADVFPDASDFPLDFRVLAFAAVVAIGTSLLFGMAPVWQIITSGTEEALRNGGRRIAGDRRQILRRLLGMGQIAIALVLLISAGLLTDSFLRLRAVSPGFDPRQVLTAGVTLPSMRYPTDANRAVFFEQLLERLRTIPGVSQAALVTPLPMSGDFDTTLIEIPGRSIADEERNSPDRYVVSPDYFAMLKIPLLQGRLFDDHDDAAHKDVALISQTAARVLWPGESPIGKKVRAGSASGDFYRSPYREIVGVVGDVAQYGLGLPSRPQIYMPHAQFADRFVTLLLRAKNTDPISLAAPLRRAVLAADAEQPIYDVIPFQSLVDGSLAARRFAVWMLIAFALGALALAASGIYGVISYTVAQRTQEFGIRMALGASPSNVLRDALAMGVPMIVSGIIAGLLGSFAASRFLHAFLFGASSIDLSSFAGVPVGMILVALAACYVPARRAAKMEPLLALRQE